VTPFPRKVIDQMNNSRVLIVDDETAIRRFLRVTLTTQSYLVFEAGSGREAIERVTLDKPDIVILDLGLPDIDGIEVTRLLREWTQVPIIILSVRGAEIDKITALDAGADDYLTKPFGVGELLARLRGALRRANKIPGDPVFVYRNLKADLSKRQVLVDGQEVSLTPHEYGILRVLITNAGKVLTHHHLLREVWGSEYGNEFHMLHVNISNLRRKIESDPARPQLIITEPGVGYRLKIDE
jgi:two-component system, OmpR family, KDP operon response regulator KdpE